ncbi:MAG TPA: FAD-dependent monooxygenase [Micromonosporaceae bacterium]|nr:FAD-dependent monooxygenase [Micromonosporaceae bacterium]
MTARAVVLGGGLAGVLAARALAPHFDAVTVVERDRYPDGPRLRRGVPQAQHAHLLMSGGAAVVDALLPGTIDRLLAAGAHRIGLPEGAVSLTAYGWQHRFPAAGYMLTCSRSLIDWVVREEVLRDERVAVLENTTVTGLCGDAGKVTGARVLLDGAAEVQLGADLVVNATGRGSSLRRWLRDLGTPPVEEDVVDTGITYATRVYRATHPFPPVVLYADHRVPRPGQNGALLPIEDGRWIVTLSGTRGGEPPMDEAGFLAYARGIRHPLIAELIATAEPLTPVRGTRSTVNRRLRFERLGPGWPEGLVVAGDAVAAFNPVYGHGMSTAARAAAALDLTLRRHGPGPGLAAAAQRAVGAAVDDAWILATMQDICYPQCRYDVVDPRLARQSPQGRRLADLVGLAAVREPVVSAATIRVNTLSAPLDSLEEAEIVAALRRPPAHPALTEPPLTAEERASLASPPVAPAPPVVPPASVPGGSVPPVDPAAPAPPAAPATLAAPALPGAGGRG